MRLVAARQAPAFIRILDREIHPRATRLETDRKIWRQNLEDLRQNRDRHVRGSRSSVVDGCRWNHGRVTSGAETIDSIEELRQRHQ